MSACLHCGQPILDDAGADEGFCCPGCQGAYALINGLGLSTYYQRRTLDPEAKSLRPEDQAIKIDYHAHILKEANSDVSTLHLMVEGVHCAACVWLIESVLSRQDGVVEARVNMTTRRLTLKWHGDQCDPNHLAALINGLGYRLVPYDPAMLASSNQKAEKELLRALAVAGFAAANVMLFSISIWAGYTQGMDQVTRDLMHWLSALVAMPAVAYAGLPFFRSAIKAIGGGRLNMDVPISLAVILATGMSLFETLRGSDEAYFDSAVMLLFFLLIGRYLDHRARAKARGSAEHLLALNALAVTVLNEDGSRSLVAHTKVSEGMIVLVAAGERVGIDGIVEDGESDLDNSLITGETVSQSVKPGDQVFAGTINLSAPLRLRVSAVGEGTLLAEIVRLMEAGEQGRAKYVALADRVARYYAPVVHGLALVTFIGWMVFGDIGWQQSLLHAIAVLIITCPCALALAVPVVQVIATGRLLKKGVLVKSPTALERLAEVDHVVFDKTGTLTQGQASLINQDQIDLEQCKLASSLAASSKHPLAKSLVHALGSAPHRDGVIEVAGRGMSFHGLEGEIRLGSRSFCEVPTDYPAPKGPELWLRQPGKELICFAFEDKARSDALAVVDWLKAHNLEVSLLSGDRKNVVAKLAESLGISKWQGEVTPAEKASVLSDLASSGTKTLMIGDGLNDAPALALAHVSLSPSSAVDVSQTVADAIFQGERLGPVTELLGVAKKAERLVKQNFVLAFVYNGITVPLAVAGIITPLIAAVAMSTSSLVVIANAVRLSRGKVT